MSNSEAVSWASKTPKIKLIRINKQMQIPQSPFSSGCSLITLIEIPDFGTPLEQTNPLMNH